MSETSDTVISPSPARSNSALLIIDMISDFEFVDGDKLFEQARVIAKHIADCKKRAKEANIPVIYVNDNKGNNDFWSFVKNVRSGSPKGKEIIEILGPEPNDLVVLKPQRSGFYATPLGSLLLSKDVSNVIVTGVTTDICVLFTAHDAFMRGHRVQVPANCSAAVEPEHHTQAIEFLKRVAEADTSECGSIEFCPKKQAISSTPVEKRKSASPFVESKWAWAGI